MKKQFLKVGFLTFISRLLGFARELLFVKSLGARVMSDAFLTAFRIPNTFYEIAAGGAFGPALVPTLSYVLRTYGLVVASRLITLLGLLIAGVMMVVVLIIKINASSLVAVLVPGFISYQQELSTMLLRILINMMVLNAGAALFAESLRTVRYFTIPACGQIIVNTSFIGGLLWYRFYNCSLYDLALFVLLGNVLQLVMNAYTWYVAGYRIAWPDEQSWSSVRQIMSRMIPCMLTAGIAEIALFIELQFASYLPTGSVSLLSYASSFARLPFGIFVYSVAVVLFPELARVQNYAKRRIPYMITEAYKLMMWIFIPLIICMLWFSYDIFATLYLSPTFPLEQIYTIQWLFIIKTLSLPFLAFNHLVLQLFYARHETGTPTIVSLWSAGASVLLNFLLMPHLGIYGVALSGTIAAGIRTLYLCSIAHRRIEIRYSMQRFYVFCRGVLLQTISFLVSFLWCVSILRRGISGWFADGFGLWLWVGPLALLVALCMWQTRTWYGVRLWLLDRRSS